MAQPPRVGVLGGCRKVRGSLAGRHWGPCKIKDTTGVLTVVWTTWNCLEAAVDDAWSLQPDIRFRGVEGRPFRVTSFPRPETKGSA
jgi:hypothetical protein